MNDDDVFSSIVGSFYQASIDPAGWDPAVVRLRRLLGGVGGGLMVRRKGVPVPDLVANPGFTDQAADLYARHFHSRDPWADFALRKPGLRGILGQDLLSAEEYARTEFWNDFMRPHVGGFHVICAIFELGDGREAMFGLQRPRDAEAFDEADRRDFERALPHLQRALDIWSGVGQARAGAALGRAALDGLRQGVLVAAPDGAVLTANRAAETLAAEGVLSLGRRGHLLAAARPEDTRRLMALVQDAAKGGAGGSLLLPRPGGGASVAAMVSRLPADFVPELAGRNAVLLVLRDLGAGAAGLAATLGDLFGLTPAEAELACALAAGKLPAQVALERGVRITTIRSQLSALLHKTGARRGRAARAAGADPILAA